MRNRSQSPLRGDLHAAVAKSCTAWGDGQDHHRACIDEIYLEDKPDLAAWIAFFEHNAATAQAARAQGRAA